MYKINIYLKEKKVLFNDLLIQLKKDLDLSGIDSDLLDRVTNEKDLIEILMQIIEDLLTYRLDLFQNLLYRIDITEEQLRLGLEDNPQIRLTEIILKREILKVYFRKKFSQ